MYFMAQSCVHVVINFLQLPEPAQYWILQPSMKTQKFHRNGQIPWLGSKLCTVQKTVVTSMVCGLQTVSIYDVIAREIGRLNKIKFCTGGGSGFDVLKLQKSRCLWQQITSPDETFHVIQSHLKTRILNRSSMLYQ